MTPFLSPSLVSLQRWEAASTHLMDSLAMYMNSCADLAASTSEDLSNAKDLASRIDSEITSLHTEIDNQLTQSRRTLIRTRNKLVASFYRVPEEILGEILTLAMRGNEKLKIPDLEHDIRSYYRRLCSLLGVCSVWYQVGVSQGKLWTLIPMLNKRSEWFMKRVAELSLDRARGHNLHLAASVAKRACPDFLDILKDPQNRYHTINITADRLPLLHEVLQLSLRSQDPHPLSELSIYYPSDPMYTHHFPPFDAFLDALINPSSYHEIRYHLPLLRALRLRGVYIHWQTCTLTRLVELRIQSVTFGAHSTLPHFIACLATAPDLRKLEIISVTRNHAGIPNEDAGALLQAHLPNLQTLHLEDLYSNDIRAVIASISPGLHHVSLYITEHSVEELDDLPGRIAAHGFNNLTAAIGGLPIHTLMLSGELFDRTPCWNWVYPGELHEILRAIPSVTTLKIHEWDFGKEQWGDFIRPPEAQSPDGILNFPNLRNLYLSRAQIRDIDGLKDIVSSHSLRKLVIGATLASPEGRVPLQDSEDLVNWLRSRVPDVRIVDHTYEPLEFQSDEWQLW